MGFVRYERATAGDRIATLERRADVQSGQIKALQDALRRVLADKMKDSAAPVAPMLETEIACIIAAVSFAHGVPVDAICGRSKVQKLVNARSEVARIAVSHGFGHAAIGRAIGGRDHSTVANLLKRIGHGK
jgi:chromosomal replication initiation ATPase DnaA